MAKSVVPRNQINLSVDQQKQDALGESSLDDEPIDEDDAWDEILKQSPGSQDRRPNLV